MWHSFMQLTVNIGKGEQADLAERISTITPVLDAERIGNGQCVFTLQSGTKGTLVSVETLLAEAGVTFEKTQN